MCRMKSRIPHRWNANCWPTDTAACTADNNDNDNVDVKCESGPASTARSARASLREVISYFELVGDIETIDKLSRVMDSIKTVSRPNYYYFICY